MFFEQKNTEYDQEKKNFQFWVGYSETQLVRHRCSLKIQKRDKSVYKIFVVASNISVHQKQSAEKYQCWDTR